MRDIEFRAWNKRRKIMFTSMTDDGNPVAILNDKGIIPMQYTGLKDKNGKKIFEGDITNHHSHKTTVAWQWSENYNQICGVEADGTHRFYFSIDSVNLEIIGNICDNPKLLKEEMK